MAKLMNLHIAGVESMPTLNGGYLVLKIDDRDFHITSVPSPNLLGERYRDTVSENYDKVEDEEGNTYSILVTSSNVGVDWTIDIDTAQNDDQFNLQDRIAVEFLANDY